MLKKFIPWLREKGPYIVLSFLIPAGIMAFAYYRIGVMPNDSGRSILASDAYSQYAMFFAGFNNMIRNGENIFFTWYGSLGLNNIAFMSYYLNSIFTPLALFFENSQIDQFVYYLTLIKFGFLGVTFWIYASQTFQIKRWKQLILAVSYALMGFAVAYSEVTMWFDGLMYLPLVILGINRLMDKRKPLLLFIFYLLLFVSNFYIAFMIGVFSFLYFCARFMLQPKQYKRSVWLYLGTSFLAGGASMPIIIPTILDISSNGESLTEVYSFFTNTADPLAIFIKNMVGVYDSTKYDTIPFIYAGTLALLLAIFFFLTKKISKRKKVAYGSVLGFIFISFYLEILNLFWHGFHSPNMLIFRFSFTFSFMILMLAGYGWEQYNKDDLPKMMNIIFVIFGLFAAVKIYTNFRAEDYAYFHTKSFLWSAAALIGFLGLFWLKKKGKLSKLLPLATILIVMLELTVNASGLIMGILNDWTYPSFSAISSISDDVSELVAYTKEENPDNFYRMENLTSVTRNDSFFFGYSGVTMFSSIRNRHSSQYLNQLGFHSTGTNLTVIYENNTLLMDSLLGIKYNLTKQSDVLKFGYEEVASSGDYTLYKNNYTLPLGILTDDYIYEDGAVDNQTKLLNHLSGQEENESMFTFAEAKIVDSQNVKVNESTYGENDIVSYVPEDEEEKVELTYKIEVPANQQAYLTIYPYDDSIGSRTTMTVNVKGTDYSFQPLMSGRYVSLGYYEDAETVEINVVFDFSQNDKSELERQINLIKPDVALLDANKFASTIEKIQAQGVDIEVDGRTANASLDLEEDRVLMTTIPYDKGWKAYLDGEEIEIPTFKDAFLAIPVSAGSHTLELVYFPYGMKLGLMICGISLLLFGCVLWFLRKKKQSSQQDDGHSRGDAPQTVADLPKAVEKEFDTADAQSEQTAKREAQAKKEAIRSRSLVTTFEFQEPDETQFSIETETNNVKTEEQDASSEDN